MKVKSLVLMALVATMGLVSCNKDENEGGMKTDTMPKSVTIKLPNIQKTVQSRATGNAMEGGSQVALENFKVFFVDADGNLQTVPQYESKDQQVYFSKTDADWTEIGENGKDITYHFLPAATSKVIVVGNIGNVDYATIATRIDDIPNDTESGHPAYPLYGEDELVEKTVAGSEIHDNVYTASVTLEPRVSRFEIYGFQYTQEGTAPKYASVKLQKIALNNYYTQSNFVSKLPVDGTKVFETIEHAKVWGWIEDRTAPWADALNLELAVGDKKFVNGTDITDPNEDGEKATGIITYGLAHVTDAAKNPELLLALRGVNGSSEVPLYLRGQFTHESAFTSGKIYRVLYSFTDGDFDEPERCVELNVDVADWTVVAVSPEF